MLHLPYFIPVETEEHFECMAERLHIAQSALSLLRDYLRSAFPRINLVALRKESVLKRQLKEGKSVQRGICAQTNKMRAD